MRVGFGLRKDQAAEHPVTFRVTLDVAGRNELTLLRREVAAGDVRRHHETFDLSPHAYKGAEVCLHAADGPPASKMPQTALWEIPLVNTGFEESSTPQTPMPAVSAEERANLEERLKAMGYVE
jgi:hypothetical protein